MGGGYSPHIWLDFKNLSKENEQAALNELEKSAKRLNLINQI